MAVSGAGCGCLAGCNLAYSGGLNCTGVLGDCTAGYQNLSRNINVPSGCTYLVTAEMKTRNYGCSSSAADGNCQACDVVKVDELSGTKLFQQGGNNSDISDSYSLTGPGTIVVSGKANRADEIITYAIIATPCNCLLSILPSELLTFTATLEDNVVLVDWTVQSDVKLKYYAVERSYDGVSWEIYNMIEVYEPSGFSKKYTIVDSSPISGTSYYRLKQVDNTASISYSKIITVDYNKNFMVEMFPNPNEDGILNINLKNETYFVIEIKDLTGNVVFKKHTMESDNKLDLTFFAKGIYIIFISTATKSSHYKLVYH